MVEALALTTFLLMGETVPDNNFVSLRVYQLAPLAREQVVSGRTSVSVESNAPVPREGTYPVRFFIDNTNGPQQRISLSVTGYRTQPATRTVEVSAGERRAVNLPVPAAISSRMARATGPELPKADPTPINFRPAYGIQRVVLSLSSPEEFEKFIDAPPTYADANVYVHAIPPAEAPEEIASYLGFDAVAVPNPDIFDALAENQRQALESYVATGGHLLLGKPLKNATLFPLARSIWGKDMAYGFGRILTYTTRPPNDDSMFRQQFTVKPRSYFNPNSVNPQERLLPQAAVPLGKFLVIIVLFTVAIGPGSVWVARKRGPAFLLVSIPATSLVTCIMIVSYSYVADGFTVHTSSLGFTLLDSRGRRAITQGLRAYYANLAPSKVSFGPSTMVVNDSETQNPVGLIWENGLTLGSDFIHSRTYREWGVISIEPTRARIIVKKAGTGWLVQNALGIPIDAIEVNIEGTVLHSGPIADGAEAPVVAGPANRAPAPVSVSRFAPTVLLTAVHNKTQPREFIAHTSGQGLVPTGGLATEAYGGTHWIRGEFEE